MQQTITEALAELKTIGKRIEKKREAVGRILARQEMLKDPHAAEEGGSAGVLARERQSAKDLLTRSVNIRAKIADANRTNAITVEGVTRSIADWLVWRREVAPIEQKWLVEMIQSISAIRAEAMRRGSQVRVGDAMEKLDMRPQDVVVNVNEAELAVEAEQLEKILGTLDGQLSLKNATITIDVD